MKNIIRTIILESLLFEDEQHVRKLFTNWANKKSGNPELALSLMDDFLKYQKKIKRDFSSFSSAEEMKQAIDQARASEVEKVKASDVNKIFENSDVLVVAANTHEASCRYAAGTKWCTGAADTDEYWKRHNRTGTEFIWIFKNIKQGNPNYKFSLHIKWNKKYDWCNAVNRCSPKIPYNLSTQSSDDFPEWFNYKAVLQKCFQYHDKRYQEKIKNLGDVSILKKKILIYVQGELEKDLEDLYYATFEGDLEYKLDELEADGSIDTVEWDNLSSEAFDFAGTKKDEIVSKSLRNITEDLSNISAEELAEEQEKMLGREGAMTNDQFIAKFIEDYMQVNGHEIMLEETSMLVDDFLDSKGLSAY